MTLLAPPLIAFACAALLGLVLAAHVLRGRFAPWALSPSLRRRLRTCTITVLLAE